MKYIDYNERILKEAFECLIAVEVIKEATAQKPKGRFL